MLLFAPPFDRTGLDPGYLKGYAPGLRKNGGQYTHAATWSIVAAAMLGDGDEAVDLFNLLSPIQHASGRANLNRYKGEPYAVAADVYSRPPRRTGGLDVGEALHIDPCIPRGWPGFEITYRHRGSVYRITVDNPERVCRGVSTLGLDGASLDPSGLVPLVSDGHDHAIQVDLG